MSEFNTSLLREKFVIHDVMPASVDDSEPIVALSNRMKFTLTDKNSDISSTYVVRAQNMHTTVRFAAQMVKDFYDYGPLVDRPKPFDWEAAYTAITKGYEKDFNPQRWVAVYQNGRLVYEGGEAEHHPFLDIIEQCDARNKGDYDKSMEIAKDAFKQAGKLVNIDHDANVALVMKVTEEEGKCGIIVRGPNKVTTFNMNAHAARGRSVKPSQCLTAAAAFLEGIQLAFFVGFTHQKERYELLDAGSNAVRQAEAASHKLGRLNAAISQFESLLNVSYRPDRPNFSNMVDDAEEFARKVLATEIEAKIASGEMDKGDWVV